MIKMKMKTRSWTTAAVVISIYDRIKSSGQLSNSLKKEGDLNKTCDCNRSHWSRDSQVFSPSSDKSPHLIPDTDKTLDSFTFVIYKYVHNLQLMHISGFL